MRKIQIVRMFKMFTMLICIFVSVMFSLCGCTQKSVDSGGASEFNSAKPLRSAQSAESQATLTPTKSFEPEGTCTPTAKPTHVKVKKVDKSRTIPILYYHNVSDSVFGMSELFVSPVEFEKQMDFLKNNNYTVITFDDLNDIENIENPVIITFDDGYENNFLEAYPILKKYNFKATIFLTTNFINKPRMLTESEIKQMGDLVNFQGHTLSHPDLTKLTGLELERELSESKAIIERLTGGKVNVFAYPTGYYDDNVVKMTKKYYDYAVLNVGGLYTVGVNNYEIKRVYVPRNLGIRDFGRKLKKGSI